MESGTHSPNSRSRRPARLFAAVLAVGVIAAITHLALAAYAAAPSQVPISVRANARLQDGHGHSLTRTGSRASGRGRRFGTPTTVHR